MSEQSEERGDRIDRIDGWDDLLLDDAGVDEALATALELANQFLADDPELSLTLRPPDGTAPTTRAATSEVAQALDEWQYAHGEGPCVAADLEVATCAVSDLRDDPAFPLFAREALAKGIAGAASFPLPIRDGRSVGSLNLFYDKAGWIDEDVVAQGEQLATTLAPMLANFLTHQRVLELTDQLEQALEGRSIIERAKGLLMARTGVDAERAFELLSIQSQHENRKVREIAAEMLEQHERSSPGHHVRSSPDDGVRGEDASGPA